MKLHTLLATVSSAVALSLLTLGPTPAAAQAVEVSLPTVFEDVGKTIQIPVTVDDITGKGVTTFFLEITFDPAVLDFERSIITNTLADVSGAGKFDGSNASGEFTVAYAAPATRPLSGSGTLVLLEATVLAEGSTDLEFQIMQLNDGDVPSNTSDGFFSTQGPTTSDLGVSLSATPAQLVIDEAFTLEAGVSNAGPDAASSVETVITLPGSVTFTSASSGCTHSAGIVTCTRASLGSGSATTHTLTLVAPSEPGSVELSAAVSSSAQDPQNSNDEASLTLTVESEANAAPVGVDDTYTVDEDAVLTVDAGEGLLANDSDANGDDLTVSLVSDVEHGTLDLNADGSFTYTPEEDFNGVDGFVYEVSDGLASDTADVTITVVAVNDPPGASVIISPIAGATIIIGGGTDEEPADGEAEALTISWTEAEDPEGDDVTYTLVAAEDDAFSSLLGAFDAGSATEVSVSVALAAQWFDAVHGSAELGATATVHLRVVSSDGSLETEGESKSFILVRGTITSVDGSEVPGLFALQGNYPNPFNPSTEIVFDLPQQAQITIDVYDALGRRVLAIPARPVSGGASRSIDVDASALPSGAYIYRITAEMSATTKFASGVMTLMK